MDNKNMLGVFDDSQNNQKGHKAGCSFGFLFLDIAVCELFHAPVVNVFCVN